MHPGMSFSQGVFTVKGTHEGKPRSARKVVGLIEVSIIIVTPALRVPFHFRGWQGLAFSRR